jgi:hypothetical protein
MLARPGRQLFEDGTGKGGGLVRKIEGNVTTSRADNADGDGQLIALIVKEFPEYQVSLGAAGYFNIRSALLAAHEAGVREQQALTCGRADFPGILRYSVNVNLSWLILWQLFSF